MTARHPCLPPIVSLVPLARLGLTIAIVIAPAGASAEEAPRDASGLPAPAWQSDSALAERWRELTGRYIFQRACVDCHGFGPERLSRSEWETYLETFPAAHEPDVSRSYSDLTAQFLPGRMVPNDDQQTDALATFLLAAAPAIRVEGDAVAVTAWNGLPRVGDPVPNFRLVDLAGREHTPADYRGSRRLVLIFSRAHW